MCTKFCRLVFLIQTLLLIQISSQHLPDTNDNNLELVTVSVIYRHGDRSPFQPYRTDPYRDPKYWPMGYAQLTNIGKMQQYRLGQYLRKRYDNFLSANYNMTEIYVRSTDVDRTLMSVQSNLAGLYPPTPEQTWSPTLAWQPIPVHTTPGDEDYLLAMSKPCDKYQQLMNALMNSTEFIEIKRKNHDFYSYLTRMTGQSVNDFVSLTSLYNTLYIEELYNMTLPEWTKPVYPAKLRKWAEFTFTILTFTPALAQLRTGPLLNEITTHLENAIKGSCKKMYMYSAHDTTLADVLNSLGLFEYHVPPYAATIFFELRRNSNNTHYVNIFYKNTTEPQRMSLKGCDFNCPLDKFLEFLAPIRLNHEEWEFACRSKVLWVMPFNTLQSSIFMGCMGLLFLILCSLVINYLCSRRRRSTIDYLRLANEEVS